MNHICFCSDPAERKENKKEMNTNKRTKIHRYTWHHMEIKHIKKEDTLETESWITARLSDPSVAGISSSRLTLSDNLNDLPSSETQVLRNRITALDSGKL